MRRYSLPGLCEIPINSNICRNRGNSGLTIEVFVGLVPTPSVEPSLRGTSLRVTKQPQRGVARPTCSAVRRGCFVARGLAPRNDGGRSVQGQAPKIDLRSTEWIIERLPVIVREHGERVRVRGENALIRRLRGRAGPLRQRAVPSPACRITGAKGAVHSPTRTPNPPRRRSPRTARTSGSHGADSIVHSPLRRTGTPCRRRGR